jgi:hypothetical protein
MAISMVRKPSETPNINNISDIIPFRYAYGGQNGYVKGKGRELDYTALGTQFTIGSGRVVLDGVESDIDSDGVIINIDSVSEARYYVVYYNVNLATNTTTIMSQYATGSYPTIEKGDDLTESPEGSANLVLYKFTATSGIISNVEKVVEVIEYSMGFKEGVATVINDKWYLTQSTIDYSVTNTLKRQGKMCFANIKVSPRGASKGEYDTVLQVPKGFYPKKYTHINIIAWGKYYIGTVPNRLSFYDSIVMDGNIDVDGKISIKIEPSDKELTASSYDGTYTIDAYWEVK